MTHQDTHGPILLKTLKDSEGHPMTNTDEQKLKTTHSLTKSHTDKQTRTKTNKDSHELSNKTQRLTKTHTGAHQLTTINKDSKALAKTHKDS